MLAWGWEMSVFAPDEARHCVRRPDDAGLVAAPPLGACGVAGLCAGFFDRPTLSARYFVTSAVYVADTGNHRVVRVDHASESLGPRGSRGFESRLRHLRDDDADGAAANRPERRRRCRSRCCRRSRR